MVKNKANVICLSPFWDKIIFSKVKMTENLKFLNTFGNFVYRAMKNPPGYRAKDDTTLTFPALEQQGIFYMCTALSSF